MGQTRKALYTTHSRGQKAQRSRSQGHAT